MEQNDLQNLLDSLDEGPLGKPQVYWSRINTLYIAREVNKHSIEGRKSQSSKLKGRKRKDHSVLMTGTTNSRYGTGFKYLEITTGFTGYAFDMFKKFGMSMENISMYAKKDRMITRGKCKGLHFKYVDDGE